MQAWLESLPRHHAEQDLRFSDFGGRTWEDVYNLTLLMTEDRELARKAKLAFYDRQLLERRARRSD